MIRSKVAADNAGISTGWHVAGQQDLDQVLLYYGLQHGMEDVEKDRFDLPGYSHGL